MYTDKSTKTRQRARKGTHQIRLAIICCVCNKWTNRLSATYINGKWYCSHDVDMATEDRFDA